MAADMKRALALIALVGTFAGTSSSSTISPGTAFQVESYALTIQPDLVTGEMSGVETVVVRSTSEGLVRIAFSPNALRIFSATADGKPVGVSTGRDRLVFVLPDAVRRGSAVKLSFKFGGRPSRGVVTTPNGLYTSYFACDWMVCLQDAPGDKASLALDLHLPAGVDSAGVGRRGALIGAMDGRSIHRWRSTRPYSPYLYGFAAGRFPRATGRSSAGELVYLDATGGGSDLAATFAGTAAIAEFLSSKAGLPLPDGRYVQVLVPGGEAQEAAGFSLIGKEVLDEERTDPASSWIVAHEMAHQWWGNSVTCATWRDFWLNEGMATFMVAAWKEHSLGAVAYQRELDVARRRVARVRELGFDKPLAWPGRYPSLGARRAVQYSKAALFLATLRAALGDAAFWRGVRDFTRGHAGGTVTSRDFQVAMERASGRDLAPMFAEWVFGRDAPADRAEH